MNISKHLTRAALLFAAAFLLFAGLGVIGVEPTWALSEKPEDVIPLDDDLPDEPELLFIQQDQVTLFPPNGAGIREGTVRGAINGSSITNFQFVPTGPTTFTSDELSLFADSDGDQILFHVTIDGRFEVPLKGDVDENFPGRENLALVVGLFSGMYEVVKATGKYQTFLGRKFPTKGLAMTPARNPAIGTVYMEIFKDE